ncbi:unnamed protein product [Nesidiocoris tenuis]|uniref:Uncharacterized protein n=1 Tax=Nesidiocoris tenuis TaxID=355587 RepID=A0A6H5GLE2_9HEMI|nr:unnamed protein product [Nesidiocoris tenuis]
MNLSRRYDPYMRSAFRPWHHALAAHIDEKAFGDRLVRSSNFFLFQRQKKGLYRLSARSDIPKVSEAVDDESAEQSCSGVVSPSRQRPRPLDVLHESTSEVEESLKEKSPVAEKGRESSPESRVLQTILSSPDSRGASPVFDAKGDPVTHVSVVRSSPVSVITSQAAIKMEPLSDFWRHCNPHLPGLIDFVPIYAA